MLRSSLPKNERRYGLRQTLFSGIDRTAEGGQGLWDARGADLSVLRRIGPMPAWERVYTFPISLYPQSMSRIGDRLFTFCREVRRVNGFDYQEDTINLTAMDADGRVLVGAGLSYRDNWDERELPSDWNLPRSMVQFNHYEEGGRLSDAVGGKYDKKLLVFPDKMWVDLPLSKDGFIIHKLDAERTLPDLRYVTVHAARLFGVDANRIYASAYNDPTDWDVDTSADIGAGNAWVSTTGADTRADGDFTGIAGYDGGVIAFKRDFAHTVSGDRNPFRVRDTDAAGALDARSIVRMGGRLYFAAEDGVKCCDGSSVQTISAPLGIERFHDGIAAGCGNTLYLLEEGVIYAYHTRRGVWSALQPPDHGKVISLSELDGRLYALTQASMTDNCIYRLSAQPAEWYVETGLYDFSDDSVKRICALHLVCDLQPGARVRVYLLRDGENTGEMIADSKDRTGALCLRALVRAGAGHAHRLRMVCNGNAYIRSLELFARKGVREDA